MSTISRCSTSWRVMLLLSRTGPLRSPQMLDRAWRSFSFTASRKDDTARRGEPAPGVEEPEGSEAGAGAVDGTSVVRDLHAPANSRPISRSFFTKCLSSGSGAKLTDRALLRHPTHSTG